MITLAEYNIEYKTWLLLTIIMVLKELIRGNSGLGKQNHTQNASTWSKCIKEFCESRNILAEDLTCKNAASGNFYTFSMSDLGGPSS